MNDLLGVGLDPSLWFRMTFGEEDWILRTAQDDNFR